MPTLKDIIKGMDTERKRNLEFIFPSFSFYCPITCEYYFAGIPNNVLPFFQ